MGHPKIAWAVVVAVMAWLIFQRAGHHPQAEDAVDRRLQFFLVDVQLRYLVGASKSLPQQESGTLASAVPLDRGPIDERLAGIAVVGELAGPKEALDKLRSLEKPLADQSTTAEQRATAAALVSAYSDRLGGKLTLPSLTPADRELLAKSLGWSGRLALHPAGGTDEAGREELLSEAKQTFVRLLALLVIVVLLAAAGLAALAAIVALLVFRPQSRALPQTSAHGGIYAETFAIWMVTYIAFSRAAQWLPVEASHVLLIAGSMLLSMLALLWPMARGVGWQTVRDDLGLNFGRRPLVEVLLGPVAYLAGIPLATGGLVIVLVAIAVVQLFTGAGGELDRGSLPSHPAVGWLLAADWREKLQILFLAGVMAPLMEESLFRGALYRHLRDSTHRLGYIGSVLASAVIGAFVFAAIHPQGWIAVPALMGLACAFTLVREWRGTLLPAMIAHGLNNTLLMCVLIWLAG